jgi:hypothetical protein
MAITVAKRVGSKLQEVVADITLDSSYPTGGYLLQPGDVGLSLSIELLASHPAGGYAFEYDQPTSKLKVYRIGAALSNPLSEVPAATNLSAVKVRVVAFGY